MAGDKKLFTAMGEILIEITARSQQEADELAARRARSLSTYRGVEVRIEAVVEKQG